ncbi:polysaccharide biosynthesis protein CapD [Exiguobacterium sibiricum 255-15]|uniref:Polysaccharide biosynthesis protein CapD n=1 Tax=Exiguobacterium sibiricum (strain DSM 17290 / CCUG 55495 / CIP 109462 / JCM 13490 / 255-15) TaxID=262543 RepID=B1YMM2_EXIS2|nr:nucleoside-diphosphate sugar epimerase/dehydratase [Exiguobacterium sibiricum]ACB62082.1 polysaccharide biosynthesis protein CapD [Exiguobacterium sibiricum 255-15]
MKLYYYYRTLTLACIDAAALVIAMSFTYFFLYPKELFKLIDSQLLLQSAGVFALLFVTLAFLMKLYRVNWKYASVQEAMTLSLSLGLSSIGLMVYQNIIFNEVLERITILSFCIALLLLGAIRVALRLLGIGQHLRKYALPRRMVKSRKRTLVIGAGRAGRSLVRQLYVSPFHELKPVAFLDDDPKNMHFMIQGIEVVGTTEDLKAVIEKHRIEAIVLAIPSLTQQRRIELITEAKTLCKNVQTLPMIEELITGKISVSAIRDVSIEDLLGREPVELDISGIKSEIEGRTVLVTGAGGSIGSEICRQIIQFNPTTLVLLGHGENSIYLIERELRGLQFPINLVSIIADVQDRTRLEEVFATHKPQVVFHAAAHKHVPLMEANPYESVKNNVYGTKNVAEVADLFNVERFVMISTDKAVNPTNVMGSTKRIAEMVIQDLGRRSKTKFAVVRFGNVLGSRGSVIPLFKSQILAGGPVTVTHPEMTRFFMTIPEASRLVIQAGILADGGEVFVLDMGEPVKIVDLAKNMIELSGFTEDEMPIVFSGIRPGEKMYEELLKDGEVDPEAIYPKIFVGRTRQKESLEHIFALVNQHRESPLQLRNVLLDIANDVSTLEKNFI